MRKRAEIAEGEMLPVQARSFLLYEMCVFFLNKEGRPFLNFHPFLGKAGWLGQFCLFLNPIITLSLTFHKDYAKNILNAAKTFLNCQCTL